MRPHIDEIRAAGGDLVIVGNGAPFFAEGFRAKLRLAEANIRLLTDESLSSYQMLGFRRGVGGIVNAATIKAGLRAFRSGFRQKKTMGDALQLGGTLVIRPDGEIVYRYIGEEAGDHADPATIVAALRHATDDRHAAHPAT